MTVIDSSGGIVRQEQFPVIVDQDRLACSRDGRFAAIRYLRGGDYVDTKTWTFSQIRGSVLVSDSNGAFQQVLSDIPVRVPRPLGQSTMLAVSSSHLYLGTNDSAVVELYTLNGDSKGQAAVSVSRRRPTAQEYDLGIEAHLAVVFASFAERREHKDRFTRIPPPEFLPLYGPLVVDAAGTAWVVISWRITDIRVPSHLGDADRISRRPRLWQAPAPVQDVVNGYKDESHIGAPQKAFDQPQKKSAHGQPGKRRQHDLEKLVHMQTLRCDQSIQHTEKKAQGRKDSHGPGNDFDIEHGAASFRHVGLCFVVSRHEGPACRGRHVHHAHHA